MAWHGSGARDDGEGGSFGHITGANSAAYTPVEDDAGKLLRATVTYTDPQGSGKTAVKTSAAVVTEDTCAAPSVRYDIDGNGMISRVEVEDAILDWLGIGTGTCDISRTQVEDLILEYLGLT